MFAESKHLAGIGKVSPPIGGETKRGFGHCMAGFLTQKRSGRARKIIILLCSLRRVTFSPRRQIRWLSLPKLESKIWRRFY
jgi:hypothetical protein